MYRDGGVSEFIHWDDMHTMTFDTTNMNFDHLNFSYRVVTCHCFTVSVVQLLSLRMFDFRG